MRIGIDISSVIYGTGVSEYTRELVKVLIELDKKNEYVLYGGSLRRMGEIKDFFHTLRGLTFQDMVLPIAPTMADYLWNKLHKLPIENLIGQVDVFHSSDWVQPPTSAFKVTTVHDLVPILYPEWSDPKIVKVHSRRLQWVKKEADAIIVPSESTKKDLVNLGFEKEKVKVIPEGVSSIYKPQSEAVVKSNMQAYHVDGDYLLAVGVTHRKNIERVISAFKMLDKDLKLVVVGHPYVKLTLPSNVIVTGHVSDADIVALYSGAKALVYPSLYEGFGIPILNAFATDTPVVTSKTGSMAEVAGDAAVLVDPENVESIAGGIALALKDAERLVKKGKKRVKNFSWQKMAKQTLEVYKQSSM